MNTKQKIAIASLPILTIMMLGVFQFFASFLGRETAWYCGFWVYWPLWCILFPSWLLGWNKWKELFRHKKFNKPLWLVFIFPIVMTFIGRFVMSYDQADLWGRILLFFMAFANGIMEEVLWRGVFITLFPGNIKWSVIWPTIWFALWHLAPGSISISFSPWVLMAGAAVFGACWGWLAMKSKSIRWSAISHILTGLVRVFG